MVGREDYEMREHNEVYFSKVKVLVSVIHFCDCEPCEDGEKCKSIKVLG